MSMLLQIIGAIAVVAGIVMAGFGIPVSEFSFGNTLIIAGATVAIGGLVVVGLGSVVAKLQHIVDVLAERPLLHAGGAAAEPFEAAPPAPAVLPRPVAMPPRAAPATVKAPAPARERETAPAVPRVTPLPRVPGADAPARAEAPTLPNPDVPPVALEDEVSLSPQQSPAPDAQSGDVTRPVPPFKEAAERRGLPEEGGWRPPMPSAPPVSPLPRRPANAFFKSMWSGENKPPKPPATPEPIEDTEVAPSPAANEPPARAEPPPAAPASPESASPRVAVLKSGVVDGMGYTLYVDGSIEAELPQGTLRFASINELRSHLEKNN